MIWVSRNFPGGNIELIGIEGNTVRVRQDVTGCGERWFYWNFALTVSAPGEYRVCFDDSVYLSAPCVRKRGGVFA